MAKNREGGISRLCPLPQKNAYEKNGWLGIYLNISLLQNIFICMFSPTRKIGDDFIKS